MRRSTSLILHAATNVFHGLSMLGLLMVRGNIRYPAASACFYCIWLENSSTCFNTHLFLRRPRDTPKTSWSRKGCVFHDYDNHFSWETARTSEAITSSTTKHPTPPPNIVTKDQCYPSPQNVTLFPAIVACKHSTETQHTSYSSYSVICLSFWLICEPLLCLTNRPAFRWDNMQIDVALLYTS